MSTSTRRLPQHLWSVFVFGISCLLNPSFMPHTCRGARQLGGPALDEETSFTVDTLLGDRRQELPSICARNIAQSLVSAGLQRSVQLFAAAGVALRSASW